MKINLTNINFKANKISSAQAKYFKNTLQNSKKVNIICHTGTDPDSAASGAVIASYLAQLGVKSKIIASKPLENLGVIGANKYSFINEKQIPDDEKIEGTTLCLDFSSTVRVSPKAQKYLDNADKLLCIDHHKGIDIVDHDYIYINSPLKNSNVRGVASCYIDSSAKSATSIIYRLFEALNEEIDNEKVYNMFLGLADDSSKRGYLTCDGIKGEIELKEEALKDKNFIEVYEDLRNKLSKEQIANIAKEVDRTSNLTKEEKDLQDFLYQNITLTPDKKIAYVVIDPDNEIWKKAGGDTPVVSTILNKFRQDILLNKENIEDFKNLEASMVFYRANGNYRVSLHSKEKNLHPVYEYVEKNCPADNISIGGHATRGGGRITTLDKESQNLWVNILLEAGENCL